MILTKDFNYSYWELKTYFKKQDLIIIGSGIVGLSASISYKEKNPKASVLILERGLMPDGASSKNAGFACFGSAGEILADLEKIPETTVWETIEMRWHGLQLLRKRLKDKNIDYKEYGGFELFKGQKKYQECATKLNYLNSHFKLLSGLKNCYSPCEKSSLQYFAGISEGIFNRFEGQIDTALMMKNLQALAIKKGVSILNSIEVENLLDTTTGVELNSKVGIFKAEKVLVATNGFALNLLKLKDVKPARAQVLITKPIQNLIIKGSYHFDEGFYYFRNIDNRILFGGGRNMDTHTETTSEQGLNLKIQNQLSLLLRNLILPGQEYEIEHRWSGIMGLGKEKKPIIQNYSKHVVTAVRMGGMGIAIGTWVGKQAAKVLD